MNRRDCPFLALSAEVVVAGAGPSGVAAALAAAQAGAEVLLVDAHAQPGGTLHYSGLHALCGLYFPDTDRPIPVSDTARMWAQAIGSVPQRMGRMYILPVKPGQFSQTALKLLAAQPKIKTAFTTTLRPGDRLEFRSLVDATGHAAILNMAGQPTVQTEPTCPGMGFCLGGVDTRFPWSPLQILRYLIRLDREFLPCFVHQSERAGHVRGVLNLAPKFHADEPAQLLARADECLDGMVAELRTAFAAFKRSRLEWRGENVGLRSGRVFAGTKRLDENMIRNCDPGHACVRGFWPVEWWRDLQGPQYLYPPPGGYVIPDECLRVSHSPSIHTAGMSLSSTSLGQAAVRVAGVCFETGRRAGELAARDARQSSFCNLTLNAPQTS